MAEKHFDLYDRFATVNAVDQEFYKRVDVKRGLRNQDGTGVLAGVTNISNVHGYLISDGLKVPDEGSLQLRGYELYDLLGTPEDERRFRYEEIAYLLLMGELPTQDQLTSFIELIDEQRDLPEGFTVSMILRDTPNNIMNTLARTIISLYAHDPDAESRTADHEIRTAVSFLEGEIAGRRFDGVLNYLLYSHGVPDPYMCLADFDSYTAEWERMIRDTQNKGEWRLKSLVNIAKSGYFSSDRSITEYAEKIWKISPLT